MSMESDFRDIDFSRFSKVKESLRQRLHQERAQKRELDWEELDQLAAAGTRPPCADDKSLPKEP